MFRYQAPNPYNESLVCSFLNFISCSESIGKLVLFAQLFAPDIVSNRRLNQLAHIYNLVINTGSVTTYDSAVLDTIELKPDTESNKPVTKQYFIIKFNENAKLYEKALPQFAYDANKLSVTVIGFNYRGVGNSKKAPVSFHDLVIDGIAQVQRLLDSGVDSKKITLDGLSLGGAVATMVASHFHKIGKPVYLWNDRSFASLSKMAADMIAPEANNIGGEYLARSLESTSRLLMNPLGWDVNVVQAYNSIPDAYKNYMYIAKKSVRSSGDGVIAHRASLHKGVKNEERNRGIKTGHKVYGQGEFFNRAHNLSRSNLVSTENPSFSGQDQFEFYIRNHKN